MSLDVYLTVKGAATPQGSGIFVRESGTTREISREEWEERFPGTEPVVVAPCADGSGEVYSANITHNLGRMAEAAGVYQACWRPEELGIAHARDLVEPLDRGLATLLADPARFRALNPSNGWGDYEGLVAFVGEYLAACHRWPSAEVSASR